MASSMHKATAGAGDPATAAAVLHKAPVAAGFSPALDGVRAVMCLWMIVFHSYCWTHFFLTVDEYKAIADHPLVRHAVLPGFMAVDVFFVLTGYLLAAPLFRRELAAHTKREEEAAEDAVGARQAASVKPWPMRLQHWALGECLVPVSISSWVFRRVMRVLPGVAMAAFLWCVVMFPEGNIPVSLVRNEDTWRTINNHFPGATHMPNGCDAVWANLAFANQLLPFGGCMAHTWSLGVQVHFYLILPLLWNLGGKRLLLRVCILYLCFATWLRAMSQFLQRRVLTDTDEVMYFGFFWYSFTLTRLIPVVTGVIAAYGVVYAKIQDGLRRQPVLVWAGWVATALCAWGTRATNYEDTMKNPLTDPVTMVVASLIHPGGLVAAVCVTFSVVCVDHRVGGLGTWLSDVLSASVWKTIAKLSFMTYLLHPMVMQKAYATVLAPIQASGTAVACYAGVVVVISLIAAWLLHTAYDAPLQRCIGRRRGSRGSRTRTCATYGVCWLYMLILAASCVFHIAFMCFVTKWHPDETSYMGLGPNATHELVLEELARRDAAAAAGATHAASAVGAVASAVAGAASDGLPG